MSAQAQSDVVPANVRFDFRLPTPTGNRAFRNLVDGVADLNISTQVTIAGPITIGIAAKYGYYRINDLTSITVPDGKMHFVVPYLKIGYEQWLSDRLFWDFSLKGGYGVVNGYSQVCKDKEDGRGQITNYGVSFEPVASIYLLSEDNLAFSMMLSYTYFGKSFNPDLLCLDESSFSYTTADTRGGYQTISIGFGANIFIGRNRPFKK